MSKNTFRSLSFLGAIISSCCSSSLFAIDIAVQDFEPDRTYKSPWFTGSLLSPGGYVVPWGHYNIQPYYSYTWFSKKYNKHWNREKVIGFETQTLILPFKMGLGKGWDFGITPSAIAKHREGQSYYGLTDWVFGFSYQLLDAEMGDPYPGIRLIFKGVIPLGKYQHLNPKKQRADVVGDGAWWPTIGLGSSKIWRVYKSHYVELRGGVLYFFSTPVHVKGYNTYGGSKDTDATVFNGNVMTVNLGLQYNVSQHIAFAFDFLYKHKNKTHYKGFAGTGPMGTKLSLKAPSNENFSIAPALEYNFNENMGLIGGVWLSVKGRNSFDFTSGIISFNKYF